MDTPTPFMVGFKGYFKSILKWDDFDRFWAGLSQNPSADWYIYAIGSPPPQQCASTTQLGEFIHSMTSLLHQEHHERYCGIVYVDDLENPQFIKIYDPNNLGSVCGCSSLPPPLPGWVLSKSVPMELHTDIAQTGSRRRWWERIFKAA